MYLKFLNFSLKFSTFEFFKCVVRVLNNLSIQFSTDPYPCFLGESIYDMSEVLTYVVTLSTTHNQVRTTSK